MPRELRISITRGLPDDPWEEAREIVAASETLDRLHELMPGASISSEIVTPRPRVAKGGDE